MVGAVRLLYTGTGVLQGELHRIRSLVWRNSEIRGSNLISLPSLRGYCDTLEKEFDPFKR